MPMYETLKKQQKSGNHLIVLGGIAAFIAFAVSYATYLMSSNSVTAKCIVGAFALIAIVLMTVGTKRWANEVE